MAVTIEELLINLGVDVSGFKSGIDAAAKSFDGLTASGTEAKSVFDGIEDATARVAEALEPISKASSDTAKGVSDLGDATKSVRLDQLEGAAASAAQNLAQVSGAASRSAAEMRDTSAAAQSLAKNIGLIAVGGNASAERLLQIARAARELVTTSKEGAASIGRINAALVAASIAPSISGITAALVKFAPVAVPATIAAVLLRKVFGEWAAQAEADAARITRGMAETAESIAKLTKNAKTLEFEASIAHLNEFDKAIARNKRSIEEAAQAAASNGQTFSKGLQDSLNKSFETSTLQIAFATAVKESQQAGAQIAEAFQASAATAVAELGKIKEGLQFESSEGAIESLRRLGEEINFSGPLGELQELQAALEENEVQVRAWAEANQISEEATRKEIALTNNLVKGRFREQVRLRVALDADAAQRQAAEAFAKLNSLPPVSTSLVFSPDTLARLLAARSTILSRIAGEPDATLRLQAEADLRTVDSQIAAERAKQEAQPIDIAVNADTAAAEAALARLRQEAAKPLGIGGKPFFQEFGDAASGGEIRAAAGEFASAVADALASANVAALRDLKAQGDAFVKTFAPSVEKLRAMNTGGQFAQALRDIQGALGSIRFVPLSGAGGTDLTSALSGFFQKQTSQTDEQIAQQRETNDLARAQLETTQKLNTSVINSATSTRETLRIATGVR